MSTMPIDWSKYGGFDALGSQSLALAPLDLGLSSSQIAGTAPRIDPASGPLGFNMPTAQLAMSGLNTIGNLWGAFQAAKMAKKQFRFQKDFANRNLENQTKTYNTAMGDRVGSRQAMYAGSQNAMSAAQAQAYLDANKLSEKRVG